MEPADVVKNAFRDAAHEPVLRARALSLHQAGMIVITYRTNRAALEEAVPEPLTFDEPLVRCEFMRMESSTGFGQYSGRGAAHSGQASTVSRAPTHITCISMCIAPISAGRELWGFPQKLGKPHLAVEHDTLVGTFDYGPVQVARGTMGYKHRALDQDTAMQAFNEPGFLLKIIPHVDGKPRICELVRYFPARRRSARRLDRPLRADLHPHALAPLTKLPVLEVVSGVHLIADFTLPHGEVVHDYLA